jgi:trigger factor
MLKKMYGEAIEYRASEEIANKRFWELVESEELKPISAPQLIDLKFEAGKELSFKIKYEVKPKFEVKDYKNLEVEKPIFKVTDEIVEKEVNALLKESSTFEPADEVTDNNFRIFISLRKTDAEDVIKTDEEPQNTQADLNDVKVSKELAEGAMNKKVGDTFNFSFTDEHKHGDEVHKEEFHYLVTITGIEKIIPPETNEEFCKKISNDKASNMDEVRKMIRENYEKYYADESDKIYTDHILNKIVENNEFDLPRGYAATVLERLVENEINRAKQEGYQNIDKKTLKQNMKERADWYAKWQIISENLSDQEGIKVEESDLQILAEKESAQMGISKDKLLNFYKTSNRKDSLLEEKLIKFLKGNNPPTEFDPEDKIKETEENKPKDKE